MEAVGQRRTTHLVCGTRVWEWTGFHHRDRWSFMRSSGTSESSVLFSDPRTPM